MGNNAPHAVLDNTNVPSDFGIKNGNMDLAENHKKAFNIEPIKKIIIKNGITFSKYKNNERNVTNDKTTGFFSSSDLK